MNNNDSQDALEFFPSQEEWDERFAAQQKKSAAEFAALGEKYLGKPLGELENSLTKLINLTY